MSKEQTRPSESLVQELLNERRSLKVAVERLKLELADVQSSSRAEATQLREERDGLRAGIEKALQQLSADDEREKEKAPPKGEASRKTRRAT